MCVARVRRVLCRAALTESIFGSWGPFWIATTLIFAIAAASNFASWLDNKEAFSYDFETVLPSSALLLRRFNSHFSHLYRRACEVSPATTTRCLSARARSTAM
jgi:hypothetical protein